MDDDVSKILDIKHKESLSDDKVLRKEKPKKSRESFYFKSGWVLKVYKYEFKTDKLDPGVSLVVVLSAYCFV